MEAEAPIFDPGAFRLSEHQAALVGCARRLAAEKFAARAARHDRDASFPTENYRDLHAEGLLAICVPRSHGGLGADYRTYALAAAEIARHCGATALTWNMHVCSTLWAGIIADDLEMDAATRAGHERRRALHFRRIAATARSTRSHSRRAMHRRSERSPSARRRGLSRAAGW